MIEFILKIWHFGKFANDQHKEAMMVWSSVPGILGYMWAAQSTDWRWTLHVSLLNSSSTQSMKYTKRSFDLHIQHV